MFQIDNHLIEQHNLGGASLIDCTLDDFIMPTQIHRIPYPLITECEYTEPDIDSGPLESNEFYKKTGSIPIGWRKPQGGPRSKTRIIPMEADVEVEELEIDCDPQEAKEFFKETGTIPWGWKKTKGPRSKATIVRVNMAAVRIDDGKFFLFLNFKFSF